MLMSLSHSPADITRWLLVAMGVAANPLTVGSNNLPTGDWPAYQSSEPNVPENCLTIKDTTGHSFGQTQIDGEILRHPGVQIRIRSCDEPTGYQKAEAIRMALTQTVTPPFVYQTRFIIPPGAPGAGAVYLVYNFNSVGDVIALGKEGSVSKRSIHTLNACIVVRQVS